jgi:predicted metalloendopeptidase
MPFPGEPLAVAHSPRAPLGLALIACSGLLAACSGPSSSPPQQSVGLDVAGIDRSVTPGDDFFRYANGAWLKSTEIPPDRSSYGSGAVLVELTTQRVADLLRAAGSSAATDDGDTRKVGDYYATFMDEAGIEKKGLEPLQAALRQIDTITDRKTLARALGATLRADVDILNATNLHTPNLFGLWVAQDLDDPAHYAAFLVQGGLEMPDRDYYLSPSEHMQEIRTKYQAHIATVLRLAQVADADAKAAKIFDLEHRMAEVHWSRAESEEVTKGNNHWSRQDFDTRAPGLDWQAFFSGAGLEHRDRFIVWQPSALTGLSALVASQPLDTWKEWLRFHAIEHAADYLPKAFVDEQFAFYGTTLSGTPELRPRWKRAVDATNDALGEAVGKLYVQRWFPASEKERAQALVGNLLAAFRARIDKLEWMAPQTKERAKAKLATLKVYVGYPDHWRDYSALRIERGDALGNAERAERFEYQRNLAKLDSPVDRSEWVMTPQTVNAVNLPAMNALNFPAAILQPPYFDAHREQVMDYGAVGAIIGHEISHSFDDQGALFDATGKLANWWTPEDFAHFQAAAARLVEEFNAYHPFPDLAVNGKQTLSENIADVAGLAAAYDAYRLAQNGSTAPAVAGFNADQLFFLSFAQSWRQKIREPALRRRIITDGHAPDEYRADTVRNLDPWYAAFNVQPGQKLYLAPTDRVRIW